jgi:hypothetical protein
MKQYIVKSGQNIFDVSLTLFGSLEGISDLMVNNESLTLGTKLETGQVLNYDEDFVIDKDLVDWFNEKRITIKNGNGDGSSELTDIKSVVVNAVATLNKNVADLYKAGKIFIDYSGPYISKPRPRDDTWGDEDGSENKPKSEESWIIDATDDSFRFYSSYGIEENWPNVTDLEQRLQAVLGGDFKFSGFVNTGLYYTLRNLFDAGIILLPSDTFDLSDFYSRLQTPKIFIRQDGSASSIRFSPIANQIVFIDWGDGGNIEYYHYYSNTQIATHVYNDAGTHLIKMYGCNTFYDLDFIDVNGVYQPLENIYIGYHFNTPYASNKNMNRLFIKKEIK